MNSFGLILRNVVFFLFPVPWLLSFALAHGEEVGLYRYGRPRIGSGRVGMGREPQTLTNSPDCCVMNA